MKEIFCRYQLWRRSYSGLRFVNAVLGALKRPTLDQAQYDALRQELSSDREMAAQYEGHIPRLREISPHKKIANWSERLSLVPAQADIFYVLPRVLRPAVMVETGVASGSMTSFVLAALHRNQHGSLYSFDLPTRVGERGMDWTAKDKDEVGFLVPRSYRDRWTLTFADATYALPRAFEAKTIDCFFHDSDHSFDHMMFEYGFATKHLAEGGWIISDDISMNEAFLRYFGGRGPIFVNAHNRNIGITVPRHA